MSNDDAISGRITAKHSLHRAAWLELKKVEYLDPRGVKRDWESVERISREKAASPVDQVEILAILKGNGQSDRVILTKQFRPPLGAISIELPAGLVDPGESPEQAAVREMKEETGYHGSCVKVLHTTRGLALEPGLTNAVTSIVHMEVDGDIAKPFQELEDGEFIEVLLEPCQGLFERLHELSLQEGYVVDAKLWTWAHAFNMNQQINKRGG